MDVAAARHRRRPTAGRTRSAAARSCTAERLAGRLRGQTAALVDGVLLLDCGPETPHAAQRAGVDLSGLRHVLITHAHPDHCAPAFLLFRSWVGTPTRSTCSARPTSIEAARMWVAPDTHVNFVTVAPGDRLSVGGVRRPRARGRTHGERAVLYDVTAPGRPAALRHRHRAAARGDGGGGPRRGVRRGADGGDVRRPPRPRHRPPRPGDVPRAGAPAARGRRGHTTGTDVVAVHLSHHNPPTPSWPAASPPGAPGWSTTARCSRRRHSRARRARRPVAHAGLGRRPVRASPGRRSGCWPAEAR